MDYNKEKVLVVDEGFLVMKLILGIIIKGLVGRYRKVVDEKRELRLVGNKGQGLDFFRLI